jgi:protein dithiol oxidoreductase (disulfide-forming)
MRIFKAIGLTTVLAASAVATPVFAQDAWVEGRHYYSIQPAQPTKVAKGQVEVIEVFSYGCPACFSFAPTADKLKASLPKNAVMGYVHASWNPSESWPLFQRAYLTALALGVADKAHNPLFNAIWMSDELAVVDRATNRIKNPQPTIDKVAAFYARTTGVDKARFVSVANSFSINAQMKSSDALIKAYRADSTPTIIVNGKYRITGQSAGGAEELIRLVNWLVAKETA